MTSGVVRVGETVRRPMTTASPAVHELLRHLERVGFDGASRLLGIDDQGREVLTFHPGALLVENFKLMASDAGYARYASLIAALHSAAASFEAAPGASWSDVARGPAGGTR